jgi:VWFA-related protein
MLKRGARTLGLATALVLAALGIVPSAEQATSGGNGQSTGGDPSNGGGQPPGGGQPAGGQPNGGGQSTGGQPNGGGAQQAPPDAPGRVQAPAAEGQPQPTFRAGINFVRVDAIVTDSKGNPVTDLKAEDFTVTEDGAPQTVESFKLIKVDEVTETTPPREIRSSFDEESEAQREDVRLFAIFLDDYHVRRGAALYSHKPLADFLRMQLRPSDMVCVMYPLTPLSDLVMSRNHEAMARAVERFDGRKYDYVPRNQIEEQYSRYPAETVERIRNQISLSAIRALVTHLGSLREGRKAVILVSEGYTNYLPPQLRNPIASMPGFGNTTNPGQEASGNSVEDRARFFSQAEMIGDLREVYDTANKNNTAFYALDPRGLAAFEHDINEGVGLVTDSDMLKLTQDTLRILADQTDGRAITNQNDLSRGLKQVVRDTSVYYLLGYNSTKAPKDGKFHEIKVKLKRPGLQVRHRKGYWALTPEEVTRAAAPPTPEAPKDFQSAMASISQRSRTQPDLVKTWLGTARGQHGRTKVTFVWEPASAPPGVHLDTPARLTVTAVAPDGSTVYRGKSPSDVSLSSSIPIGDTTSSAAPPPTPPPASTGPTEVSFEAPPGKIQLRYAVENEHATVVDTDVREIEVPDLTAPQVQLSTPVVLRARTVKEFRDLSADPNAVPTPNRDFRRTDRLILRFDAYAPASTTPQVVARLLNRAGQPMLGLDVAHAAAGTGYQLDLPLAGIAAGEYLIEVSAHGESGDTRQLVAFRVTA